MFPKQHWFAFANTIIFSSAPFATIVGLVLFGMLTAPPAKKEPTTPQELMREAETKTIQGKYKDAIVLYNRAMEEMSASIELANAYWGRGAAHLQHYTRLKTRERTLKLKAQTDISIAGDHAKIAQIAAQEFNQGMADHQKAAQIAESSGLSSCAAAIRETASRAQDGMLRYNNAYLLYLPHGKVGC